jgi:hypothetical protein
MVVPHQQLTRILLVLQLSKVVVAARLVVAAVLTSAMVAAMVAL